MLINVLHNSPISRREYFQYGYRINGYIPVCSLCRHFFLFFPPPLFFYFSATNYTAIFIIQSTKKRVQSVCVRVCVRRALASFVQI